MLSCLGWFPAQILPGTEGKSLEQPNEILKMCLSCFTKWLLTQDVLVRCHVRDPAVLAYHSAKLCSLINIMLNEPMTPSRQAIVLQSVATLALLAVSVLSTFCALGDESFNVFYSTCPADMTSGIYT